MRGVDLAKECVRKAVSDGCFGAGEELLGFSFDDNGPDTNAQFASTLVFFGVRLKNAGTVKLVMKQEPDNPGIREMMNTPVQFYNEVTFYKHVMPYVDVDGSLAESVFPHFYYGRATRGVRVEDDVVLLGDMGVSGFERPRQALYFDFEHLSLALRTLGKFHAHSYKAKAHDPVAFFTRVDELESTYSSDSVDKHFTYLEACIRRGVLPLIRKGHRVEKLNAFLDKVRDPIAFIREIMKPEPATAVVCHGDFCGNNVLYKYSEDGRPQDVRFCDLQRSVYASPTIDLSFFLCLNTNTKTKNEHWDQLLRVYYDSLTAHLPGTPVPDYKTFYEEFSRKAVYGYIILSYFLPVMLDPVPFDLPSFVSLSEEDKLKMISKCGSDKATTELSELIYFMLEKDYL